MERNHHYIDPVVAIEVVWIDGESSCNHHGWVYVAFEFQAFQSRLVPIVAYKNIVYHPYLHHHNQYLQIEKAGQLQSFETVTSL